MGVSGCGKSSVSEALCLLNGATAIEGDSFHPAANLDPLTENYDISFYLNYLARWPTYFCAMENAGGRIMGYSTFPRRSPPARAAPPLTRQSWARPRAPTPTGTATSRP